jgi:hypothetical protein
MLLLSHFGCLVVFSKGCSGCDYPILSIIIIIIIINYYTLEEGRPMIIAPMDGQICDTSTVGSPRRPA